MIVRKEMELLRRNTMFKKIIFNTITLTTLLFSCLQLHAMRISDGITDLEKAGADQISEQDFDEHTIRYALLGYTDQYNPKTGGLEKVYLIQLPCIGQTGALCGSCAYENTKVLAQKYLGLETAIEELKSKGQQRRISKRAKKFGHWVMNITVMRTWTKEITDDPSKVYMRYDIGKNYYPISFIENTKDLKIQYDSSIMTKKRKRKHKLTFKNKLTNKNNVEVFMLQVHWVFQFGGAHYITVRVEKTKKGDIAVFFADSYPLHKNLLKDKKIRSLVEIFKDLLKKLGYKVKIHLNIKEKVLEESDESSSEEETTYEEESAPGYEEALEEESSSEEETEDESTSKEEKGIGYKKLLNILKEEEDEPDVYY